MKLINNIKGLFLAVSVAVTALGLTSCKDEPDKYETAGGKPTIDYVRCLSSEIKTNQDTEETVYTTGQLVESASPQSTLCLIGSNLRSIVEMYFNNKKALLNSSYITDNTLIVDVPKEIPTEVTNKIYMITADKDTVTYDFQVIIPGPQISSMGCEYDSIGAKQTLVGQYFIDDPGTPLKVFFKNAAGADIEATNVQTSDDYTTISFVIPEGAVEGPVKVTNVYGSATSAFHYKDSRGMLFNFDGEGQAMTISSGKVGHGWHSVLCNWDKDHQNYIQLGNGSATMDDSTWDDGNFSFEYWPGNWEDPETFSDTYGHKLTDYVDFSNWENMSLKFEMCASNWSAGALQIIFAGTDAVSYGNAGAKDEAGNVLGGCNNTYISGDVVPRALYRPWTSASNGVYDTDGQWVTVTIPLKSSLVYGYSGGAPTGTVSADSFASLVIFLAGGGVTGTACTPILKIDNIRVIPN